MTSYNYRTTVSFVWFLLFALSGCGGGNTSNTNPGPLMVFGSGLHSTNAESPTNPSASNFVLVGSLIPNGSSISGIMHFQGSPCFPLTTDIPVTGTLTPTEADFTALLPNGQRVAFTALQHPPVPHPQFLGGNYSVTGPGCLPNVQALAGDEWLNFSGTYTGTFASATGNSAHVSLTLNQTGPDAHGFFSATGTATITGGTCFSSATIDPATVLLGDGSTLVLNDTAPGSAGKTIAIGTFVATSPVGFGFFSGIYTSTKGACSESGSLGMQI
ncbi:MAG TPA: hypothetical protein VFR84_18585 [Candidatus Angelobacter sp.]|nr:hypothetical protein [Candidatus Angelobacter sp.]